MPDTVLVAGGTRKYLVSTLAWKMQEIKKKSIKTIITIMSANGKIKKIKRGKSR